MLPDCIWRAIGAGQSGDFMPTTRAALSETDIRTLVKDASAEERAAVAQRLCRHIGQTEPTAEEREKAHEILRVMAADAAELVRRALAVTLCASPLLPRDVAISLARDVDTIALPVLSFSPAFTDADLCEIIRIGGPIRQVAIASRPMISERVTATLVEHGVEQAVSTACANVNAHFEERTLRTVIERFAKSEAVLAAVAYRRALPLSVTEQMISLVSDQMRDHLINHQALSPETALQIALGTRERATLDLVDQAGRSADVRGLVQHLNRAGELSASLLLRALVNGHMTFFEWGVAELATVPHHRTWLMIHDAGPLGLKAIYQRAGLPMRLLGAFRAAVDAFHAVEMESGSRDLDQYQERMLERFLTQPKTGRREDMDYLLEKLDHVRSQARIAGADDKGQMAFSEQDRDWAGGA
jgi:uncharacterized protein (DUF2336 family)